MRQVQELMRKCMELVAESMTDNLSLLELTKLIQVHPRSLTLNL